MCIYCLIWMKAQQMRLCKKSQRFEIVVSAAYSVIYCRPARYFLKTSIVTFFFLFFNQEAMAAGLFTESGASTLDLRGAEHPRYWALKDNTGEVLTLEIRLWNLRDSQRKIRQDTFNLVCV